MKKTSIFLLAGGLLALASCTNENAGGGMTQAQVDSAVNAEVEAARLQMYAEQDSIINIVAQMKADSMMAVAAGKTPPPVVTPTRKPTTTRPTTTKPAEPTTPTNTGKNDGTRGQNEGKRGAEGTPEGTNQGKRQ